MKERLAKLRALLGPVGQRLPLFVVLGFFFGGRAYYRLFYGARFDASPLGHFLQLMDKELLRDDLLRTCFYLHHQAPVLNFLAGLALKIAPQRYDEVLDITFFVGAFVLTLALFKSLKCLGVRPWLAAAATSVYTIAPPVAFYELWLMYHHLVTVFLVLSVAALLRFLRKETLGSGILYFSSIALVILTRATYGLVFMGALAGVLLWYRPVARKLVLKAAAGPMLFVALYTIKPQIQTHHSLGHALVGPNLVMKTLRELPTAEREDLFKEKLLAPMERTEPFPSITRNPSFKVPVPTTGVPALDNLENANGDINPNALEYVYIADVAMKDAKFLIKTYPDAYLRSVRNALLIGYFHSPLDDICAPRSLAFKSIHRSIEKVTKVFFPQEGGALLVLWIILPLALVYALGKLLSARARLVSNRAATPVIAVLFITIVYSASSVLISYADFSRYRFEVDVYYGILLTLFVNDAISVVVSVTKRAWSFLRSRRHAQPLVLAKP